MAKRFGFSSDLVALTVALLARTAKANGLIVLFSLLSSCASFGRGVTEAIINSQRDSTEDVRSCTVDGEAFAGIASILDAQGVDPVAAGNADRATTKLVYVHGIGEHRPGHGGDLIHSLAKSLDLSVRAGLTKRVVLAPPNQPERPHGEINILRMTDSARRRELLFYELTWSAITFNEKATIDFDRAVIYSSQRAKMNNQLRRFTNNVLPDPLAFIGNRGNDIRDSVGQTLCWALSARWQDLDALTEHVRCEDSATFGDRTAVDELIIVTQSLGSRAAVDALQSAARLPVGDSSAQFAADLKDKQITLYMLSNQLPLLEAGQPTQAMTGVREQYCGAGAPNPKGRFLRELNMVAITDPNDIMSYPIPQAWVDEHLDSRLCANVRNVTINIAHVRKLPVIGEYADLVAAHMGYKKDPRVAELMALGIGHDGTSAAAGGPCNWIEADPRLN